MASDTYDPFSESQKPSKSTQPGLGSLAQSARKTSLNGTRWLLIIIGLLTIAANAVVATQARVMIQKEIQKNLGPGVQINKEEFEKVVQLTQVVSGVMAGVGLLFVLGGIALYSLPVPITVGALIIYVGSAAVFALLDPTSIAKGLVVKVVIVVALIRAVSTAVAYQRERSAGVT